MYEIILFELKTAGDSTPCLGGVGINDYLYPSSPKRNLKMVISPKTATREEGGRQNKSDRGLVVLRDNV